MVCITPTSNMPLYSVLQCLHHIYVCVCVFVHVLWKINKIMTGHGSVALCDNDEQFPPLMPNHVLSSLVLAVKLVILDSWTMFSWGRAWWNNYWTHALLKAVLLEFIIINLLEFTATYSWIHQNHGIHRGIHCNQRISNHLFITSEGGILWI